MTALWLGEWATEETTDGGAFTHWATACETISQTDTDAVVRLTFADGSGAVDVNMKKNDGVWLPVSTAAQMDDAFVVNATVDGKQFALPQGATLADAAKNELPVVPVGSTIRLALPDGVREVTLTDVLMDEDGALVYDERASTVTHLTCETQNGVTTADYPVETHMASALSSTFPAPNYARGVLVSYTVDGVSKSAAFAFSTEPQQASGARAITAATYTSADYGYTLTLPNSFVGAGYLDDWNAPNVDFGMRNAMAGYGEMEGGNVMSLTVMLTAQLEHNFGADWTRGYPVPCIELAERDGLTYFLTLVSDVQYDVQNETTAATYRKLFADAKAMTGAALSFDGQTAQQKEHCDALRLQYQGELYGADSDTTAEGAFRRGQTVTPHTADQSCTVVYAYVSGDKTTFYATAERLWFADENAAAPSRTETIGDSREGVRSADEFRLLYPERLPEYQLEGIEKLAKDGNAAMQNPEKAAERTLGLAGGTWQQSSTASDTPDQIRSYRFADGVTLRLNLRSVQLSRDLPMIYLPDDWWLYDADGQTVDMLGRQFSPYDRVLAQATAYYPDRTTDELVGYLDMADRGWADGAYAEGIFAELDKRYAADPAAVDAALATASNTAQDAWAAHQQALADNATAAG